MSNVRVLIVDDSAAMRALFCDILEQARGVEVAGLARNADEAREKIAEVRPDVLTLDVEMPGMTGMEFLEELMSTKPMPVIMLSSIAQEGTGVAEKALKLGAVHCFPKPLHASPEEFNATVAELGEIVCKAANGELQPETSDESAQPSNYQSDGRVIALAGGRAGIDALREILAAFPANCPPTLVVLDAEEEAVENAVSLMRASIACKICDAADGAMMVPGSVYLARDPSRHAIIEGDIMPVIRLLERDPVGGVRPSADLMFGSIARAGVPVIGGLLAGSGSDGAKGLQMLANLKATTFVEKPADYAPSDRSDAVRALGVNAESIGKDTIGDWVVQQSAK